MSYTYTINDLTVNPRGEWSINYERNEGQIFFRRKFTGDLTFFDADYDLIMAAADCGVLEFKIYCEGDEYWEGQFKFPYDFDIDEDSCVCVGTPEVVDEYNCIMDNYETEYRIALAAGGVAPQLRTCPLPGALTHTFPLTYRLGASTASGFSNWLSEIINGGGAMNCGLTLVSSFMWRSNFANGDNYAAAYGVNNYITGATNRLEYIFLGTNTSIRVNLGGTLCTESGNGYWTFKQFETLLRNAFNAYWFIDENGDFRIEHHYYFDPAFPNSDYDTDLNLRNIISNNGRSYAYRRNKYTYETGRLYDQERWTWQHWDGTEGNLAHGTDFQGEPVYYGANADEKSDCVPDVFKEKELACPEFWADVDWAWGIAANPVPNPAGQNAPDTIQCPAGWCMFDIDPATGYIQCDQGALTGVQGANRHLSTANLQEYYHTYDRIFCTGHMNNGAIPPAAETTTFDTCQKHKLQEAIEFPLCCDEDPDPLDRIETELGFGEIKSMNRKQNSIEVELLYD